MEKVCQKIFQLGKDISSDRIPRERMDLKAEKPTFQAEKPIFRAGRGTKDIRQQSKGKVFGLEN